MSCHVFPVGEGIGSDVEWELRRLLDRGGRGGSWWFGVDQLLLVGSEDVLGVSLICVMTNDIIISIIFLLVLLLLRFVLIMIL